ncbi:hypothetical protein PI124_g18208 [Phytophthora idaei]|nr:hypothetical protein PI125_g18848 [Phytophthora idaei]KAG3136207.1 hypothetical protein PI126_g17911 [Phytophthora idaei]KAG3236787.1 hypothetical protein PI124_g18208 [Phytophthora idaei]
MYVRIIEGKGVSFGEQGGPLIKENNPGDADDVLVGVLSYAVGHADKGKPSVYTRVSTALEWINSFIKARARNRVPELLVAGIPNFGLDSGTRSRANSCSD